jgi:hypothetical protein
MANEYSHFTKDKSRLNGYSDQKAWEISQHTYL